MEIFYSTKDNIIQNALKLFSDVGTKLQAVQIIHLVIPFNTSF